MRASIYVPLFSLLSLAAATTTTLKLAISPSQHLANPRSLPPSTHATLTTLGTETSAYITPSNTFVFNNVSEGSYLVDVHSISHAFAPLRVDVVPVVAGAGQSEKDEKVTGLKIQAWETFRGNDWGNKGEAVGLDGGALRVKVMGQKAFFMERSSCEYPIFIDRYGCIILLMLHCSQRPKYPKESHDSPRTGQHGHLCRYAVPDGQQ